MSANQIFPTPEEKPVLERNPLNRRQYSDFKRDAVLPKMRAADMYDAAAAVTVIADMLLIDCDERGFAADESPDAAPLSQRNEWGLLCALRVCARVLHSEMDSLKEADDKAAAAGKGAA